VKLGVLLTAGVMSESTRSALRIAGAARAKGLEVEVFLMGDGVYAVKRGKRTTAADSLSALIDGGTSVALCALNAEQRGVTAAEAIPGVLFGSQYDLALLMGSADRFVYFG
jgi:sulfur relay (sulfurtransferase) complex TusBCD TusD component (DsrE family)